jgi:hypothetical protein
MLPIFVLLPLVRSLFWPVPSSRASRFLQCREAVVARQEVVGYLKMERWSLILLHVKIVLMQGNISEMMCDKNPGNVFYNLE